MKNQQPRFLVFIVLMIILGSCSSSDTIDIDSNLEGLEYYITGKLNGEPFVYGVDMDATTSDYIVGIGYLGNTSINSCQYSYQAGIDTNLDETLPSANIIFNGAYSGSCSAEDELAVFNGLFPIGNKTFVANNNESGVTIEFNDGAGKFYSTQFGSQAGSTFTITNSEEDNELLLGDLYSFNQKITGTFSCNLYNENDITDAMIITEGKFIVNAQATENGFLIP